MVRGRFGYGSHIDGGPPTRRPRFARHANRRAGASGASTCQSCWMKETRFGLWTNEQPSYRRRLRWVCRTLPPGQASEGGLRVSRRSRHAGTGPRDVGTRRESNPDEHCTGKRSRCSPLDPLRTTSRVCAGSKFTRPGIAMSGVGTKMGEPGSVLGWPVFISTIVITDTRERECRGIASGSEALPKANGGAPEKSRCGSWV